MLKGLVLAMQVGQEVFCALGQVKYGLQVDNLCAGLGHSWERLRQECKVAQVAFYLVFLLFHLIVNLSYLVR